MLAIEEEPAFDAVVAYRAGRRRRSRRSTWTCWRPTARYLGELWTEDLCSFTDVTVGLGRLQRVLRELSPSFGRAVEHPIEGRSVLLLPSPGEQHTFGLVIVGEFFRRNGWNVSGGGWNGDADASALVRGEWFDAVGFSLGAEIHLGALTEVIRAVKHETCNPHLVVLVGGPLFASTRSYMRDVGADGMTIDGREAPAAGRAPDRRDHAPQRVEARRVARRAGLAMTHAGVLAMGSRNRSTSPVPAAEVARMREFESPSRSLGDLDADVVGRLIAAAADVALIIDDKGVIRDLAFGSEDLLREGYYDWLGKPWADTVTVESRTKVDGLLRDSKANAAPRWRHINHPVGRGCRPADVVRGDRAARQAAAARRSAVPSSSGATCAPTRRCSSAWSAPSRRWSATTGACVTWRRATARCSRSLPKRC